MADERAIAAVLTGSPEMSDAEGAAWDDLNETDAAKCCSCPSCNYYAPDYEAHRDEPCLLTTIVERILVAHVAAAIAALPGDDAARALTRVQAVTFASDDGTEYEHNGHGPHEGEPECPGCWVAAIRAARAADGAEAGR